MLPHGSDNLPLIVLILRPLKRLGMNKIYINDTGVFLSQQRGKSGFQVHFDELRKEPPAQFIIKAGNGLAGKEITIWGAEPEDVFSYLSDHLSVLVAAGGVVQNPLDEVLFIFRKNSWDFPKGKPENEDDMSKTAIRGVEEECGISGLGIVSALPSTYHIYTCDNGSFILKKCFWYHMRSSNWQTMKLQTEEEITDAAWIRIPFPEQILINAFPSIRDLAIYFQEDYLRVEERRS
jgi:8-oxo-dGTP pyrophosphatase MutT (NUDIX family)